MGRVSANRRVAKKCGGGGLPELNRWQKIQDLFARIIGANLSFFNSAGIPFTQPSQVTAFCSDLAIPLTGLRPGSVDCVTRAFQSRVRGKHVYSCVHGLHFYSLGIRLKTRIFGGLVVGPILLGKREDEKTYRQMCVSLEVDPENFLDRIREIKLFSHTGISIVADFLREVTEYFITYSSQRREVERLIPAVVSGPRVTDKFFSAVHGNKVVNSLLDIALGVVEGNSGSVLLFDTKGKSFHIHAARGIRREILKEPHIPLRGGVAGWVAARGKPFLIQKDVKDPVLRRRLKRPDIYSSIVIPMRFLDRTLGVFCLNAESGNKKFNQDNLPLLDQLGQLASIAL